MKQIWNMNAVPLLTFLRFALLFSQFIISTCSDSVNTTPKWRIISQHDNEVIDWIDETGNKVFWKRKDLPLLKGVEQVNGRLIINKINRRDGGFYTSVAKNTGVEATAFVKVNTKTSNSWTAQTTTPQLSQGLAPKTESSFSSFREPSTPYPCLYGICDGTCCKSSPSEEFFDCGNGQKINKTLVCNRKNDCDDGSDEAGCAPWPPKMTVLPKHEVEIYCGDQDKRNAGTLMLECDSVGHPTPLIRWKKYEGHVPTKCTQYSRRGHGILTCPNFQQSDQGAYSCVAENSEKVAESQPKTIAKCSNTIKCNGFKVVNKEKIEHCLECFCSGRTNICQSIKSNLTVITVPFPKTETEVFVKDDGQVVFVPTKTVLTPNNKVRQSSQEITYCSLTENDLQETSLLKSFGRRIIIPMFSGKVTFLPEAPSLLIQGNGLSLMYTANLISPLKNSKLGMPIRLWPGNWHHLNKEAANRTDIMKVLSNVESILIRCEYEEGSTVDWSKNERVVIESSVITHLADSVSYVEKCSCPPGYDGLSCETCAQGYEKKPQGGNFVCAQIFVPPPCKPGYTGVNCSSCDTVKGYQKVGDSCVKPSCHPDGSTSIFPGLIGKCYCKSGVTGNYCDKCQSGYFHLNKIKGCYKCWCNKVSNQCKSSKLYRTVISNIPRGGYNYSDGRNFWLLPPDFSGNRLTSYGGFLNYTMKYKPNIPKQNALLTVEILSMDDVTISYTHPNIDTSVTATEKSWSVFLIEDGWKRVNKTAITRGEFLKVLSKIKAVYIESPYHLSSYQVNLTSTVMSSASSTRYGENQLALEVEECNCPRGYTGLSCEKCENGYYKKRNGEATLCLKCNCTYCDPDFGCQECPQLSYRDNPETEKMPVCKPCPCKENAVSCFKDDFNQIFCRCKPGYTGMLCSEKVADNTEDLTVIISPRRVRGKKTGTVVTFNCTVLTSEEMVVSAKKNHGTPTLTSLSSATSDSGTSPQHGRVISKTFEVTLDSEIKSIECFVHDAEGQVAAHAVAIVDLIKVFKPVEITNCYPNNVVLKESKSIDLICEATGLPTPMVNWYRSRNGSKPEKVDTSEGVHSIDSAPLSLNGSVYTCVAENSRGDKATCTKVLTVVEKCEVVNITPPKVITEEGKNITLTCKTTAKSKVTWEKLSSFGTATSFLPFNARVKDGYLFVTGATVSNSGTYICTAEGKTGKINKTVSVVVEEKKEFPTVFIQENDKILKVGESFEMHCMVGGKPIPTVTWKKFNGYLGTNVFASGKTLKITKAKVQNSGMYVCEAVSTVGNASSYISIEVKYDSIPPKVNISEATIAGYEGDVVNSTCLAIGYPRPKINWFAPNINITSLTSMKDNIVLIEPIESQKEKITFKISKEMNDARILCIAENEAGRDETAAKVTVFQKVDSVNETVEFVPLGSHFDLTCDFSGNITWEKLGGFVGDECPVPDGLLITSVQIQHNGTYICKSESGSKKIHLRVTGFVPKFSKVSKSYLVFPHRNNQTSGNRIELSFKAINQDGVLLQKENKFYISLHHKKVHLRVYFNEVDHLDIEMKEPIQMWKWYSLLVNIGSNLLDITIYDEYMTIHERKTERVTDFKTSLDHGKGNFFLGGPEPEGNHLRKKLPRHSSHFDGCISRLIIDGHEFDIVKEGSFSHNVTLCRQCSEDPNPCRERGLCLDAPTQYGFICVCSEHKGEPCPKSCTGKGCESQLDFCALLKPCKGNFPNTCQNHLYRLICQCPQGYTGTTCEKAQEYSFCSTGNGYVKLPSKVLNRVLGLSESIKMSFSLHKLDAQLLWQGDKANHLSISVRQGKLKYVYLNQNSKLEVHGTGPALATDTKYLLTARRINNTATLEILPSGQSDTFNKETYRNSTSKIQTNRVIGDVYLGIIPNNTIYHENYGLNGCIHFVAFGEDKINFSEVALEKVNVTSTRRRLYDDDADTDDSNYSENDTDYPESE